PLKLQTKKGLTRRQSQRSPLSRLLLMQEIAPAAIVAHLERWAKDPPHESATICDFVYRPQSVDRLRGFGRKEGRADYTAAVHRHVYWHEFTLTKESP